MTGYTRRIVDAELDELGSLPAIALDGAKGVGKTSTAEQRAVAQVRLDDEQLRMVVAADPAQILQRPRPLLIDEWQRVPEVWDVVRRAVDDEGGDARFFLTGSATPRLGATAHPGSGRIARVRMRPLALSERGIGDPVISIRDLLAGRRPALRGESSLRLSDYAREIVATGLPGLRRLDGRALRTQLDSYVQNVVDRDIPEQGVVVRKPAAMLAWLRAYAAASSSTASYTEILNAATAGFTDKPARGTLISYRDVLEQLWLLDPVPAWSPVASPLRKLAQAPKHQVFDTGIASRLLGMTTARLLNGEGAPLGPQQGTTLGMLFESLVTLSVRVLAQAAEADVSHLRLADGRREIDLILEADDGGVVAVEVKLSGTVDDRDVRHLLWLREQLGERLVDAIVVNTGPAAYRRADGIGVVPLGMLTL